MRDFLIIHYVERWELRAIFNARFLDQVNAEALRLVLRTSRPVTRSSIVHPAGTFFELLDIRDRDDYQVGVVQWFRLPDGSITYSGLPDPLSLRIGRVIYRFSERANERGWCVSGSSLDP